MHSGNGAAGQSQLGTYGDLFDTIARYVSTGHLLDQATGRMLADLADRCCDIWTREDAGLWELSEHRHYTISKIGCWVALDRAAGLADAGQLPAAHASRWRQEAADISRWVQAHCWSQAKQSYTFYAGTDDLDAAVLLAGRTGFDRGQRLAATIRALRNELVPARCCTATPVRSPKRARSSPAPSGWLKRSLIPGSRKRPTSSCGWPCNSRMRWVCLPRRWTSNHASFWATSLKGSPISH